MLVRGYMKYVIASDTNLTTYRPNDSTSYSDTVFSPFTN